MRMNDTLSISYFTNRHQCCIEWFFDSLALQLKDMDGFKIKSIIVIDHFANDRVQEIYAAFGKALGNSGIDLIHREPKPCVWSGLNRLTKDNWFSASNSRNTAIALCSAPWLVMCDDLSVLQPGWLKSIREAMNGNYIVCGAYRKVKELVVENGEVKSFKPHLAEDGRDLGQDSRWTSGNEFDAVPISGGQMFGCSLATPIAAFLQIGGFPETLCDGTGGEDYIAGMALRNNGWELKYDRRMMTFESEELHHYTEGSDVVWNEAAPDKRVRVSASFRRADWGVSPNDKSHNIMRQAMTLKQFTNDLGDGFPDLHTLRNHVLNGGQFPVRSNPRHEWWSKQPLESL